MARLQAKTLPMNRLRSSPRLIPCLLLAFGLATGGVAIAEAAPAPSSSAQTEKLDPQDDYGEDIQGNVPGASVLEGRLIAPCCWTQTIDIHDSPIALSMRHEIRRRLLNGESQEAIQASFVDRFGPKILAVQPGSPLKNLAVGMSILMAAAGAGAVVMVRRWRRQGGQADPTPPTKRSVTRDEMDDRLDAELRHLDGE